MKETLIDARRIGAAFAVDPELKLPTRPRLPPEILVIPFGSDGLIFVGAREKQLLKGRSARSLVPRVLPLLDGEHNLEQIVARFPDEPTHAVRDIVALLYTRGLLEDGRTEPPPPQLRSTDAFLGRHNDVTRMNRNRGEARYRLSRATVLVGGDAGIAAEMASSLAASGVGTVRLAQQGIADADFDLAIAVSTSERGEDAAFLDAAHRKKIVSLGTWVGRETVLRGPLNIPGLSSCYACLRSRGLPEGKPEPEVAGFWVYMTALRAIQFLTRVSGPSAFASYQLVRLQADGAVTNSLPMPRTPGCEQCGLTGPAIDVASPAYQAWSLYNATSKPPADFLGSKDYEVHYNPKNIELAQQESPACPGTKIVPLPPSKRLNGSPWRVVSPPTTVGAADLATLLARAAGFDVMAGTVRRRVAPTGGNLGSVELGVIVSRVDGLDPGIYRYHAPRHVLERFPVASAEQLRRTLGAQEALPAAVILGLGGLAKVYQKYGIFAYRIVHYDAGVAAAYIHRLATALGLSIREYPDFRDDAAADLFLLDFDHVVQVPTFAIGVEGEPAASPVLEAATLQRVIDAATSTCRATTRFAKPAMHGEQLSDAVMPPATTFDEILLGRRSIRSYTPQPIPGAVLRELCRLGIEAVSRRIEAGAPASTAIHLVLAVATGTDDLPSGIYHVHPEQPETLVAERREVTSDELLTCLLQSAHAAAPAVLFVIGDLGLVLADRGARGLRELMVQAGVAVGEVWLAATGYGLGACAAGGVIEVGLQALAGADGYRSAPLLAIALGYPREGQP